MHQTVSATLQKFLSFAVTDSLQGLLSSQQLLEVFQIAPETIVPISGTAMPVMGVSNWRGEVLWLIDVGCMLKVPRLCDRNLLLPQYTVLIAQSEKGPVGLVTEQVGQMCWVDPRDIEAEPPPPIDAALPYVPGYWRSEGKTCALVDLDRLISAL